MLLENDGRADSSLETVSFVSFDDFAKRAHRAAILLPVVRQRIEEALNFERSVEPLDEFPLGGREAFFVRNHAEIIDFVRLRNKRSGRHLPESLANVRLTVRSHSCGNHKQIEV